MTELKDKLINPHSEETTYLLINDKTSTPKNIARV